jgi:hypothetical protein
LAVDEDVSGEEQGLGALARWGQAAFEDQDVEAGFAGFRFFRGVWRGVFHASIIATSAA